MSLYVLSGKPGFNDLITAALKTNISKASETTADLVAHILDNPRSKFEVIFVDLATIRDGRRFVEFVKGSPSFASIKIVLIGEEPQLTALGADTIAAADGLLRAPCDPMEICAIIEKIRPTP